MSANTLELEMECLPPRAGEKMAFSVKHTLASEELARGWAS